jgi:hypothetical protein
MFVDCEMPLSYLDKKILREHFKGFSIWIQSYIYYMTLFYFENKIVSNNDHVKL